jgi:hypothetical protein
MVRIPRLTPEQWKKLSISAGTMILFGYIGTRVQKSLEKSIYEQKMGIKEAPADGLVGHSQFKWTSLLEKHREKIPLILGVVGAVTGSSLVLNNTVYKYLLTAVPSNLYSAPVVVKKVLKKRFFGESRKFVYGAIEKENTIYHMTEVVSVIDAIEGAKGLTIADRLEFYETIVSDILTFDRLTPQVLFTIIGFVSVLAYLFHGHLFIFSELITALLNLLKKGKISKHLARIIRNMLRIKGVTVPKELEEMEL